MKGQIYGINLKKMLFFLLFLRFSAFLYCIDFFEEGKSFLSNDQPDKAIPVLFSASKNPGTDSSVFLYLGIAYLRTGKYPEALNYLSIGRKKDAVNLYLYLYNIGNIYFLQNRYEAAEKAYSDSIGANSAFVPAFLNRANARMKLANYEGALQDYKFYLQLNPNTAQHDSIKKMIALLEEAAQAAERARALEEAKRMAEEAARAAAEERYQQLLEDVNSNLSSAEDADSVSAGAENTIDYSEENELE